MIPVIQFKYLNVDITKRKLHYGSCCCHKAFVIHFRKNIRYSLKTSAFQIVSG